MDFIKKGLGSVGAIVLTKRAVDITLNYDEVIKGETCSDKLTKFYNNFNEKEYKTKWFNKTKTVRKINVAKYMIDHGYSNKTMNISDKRKYILSAISKKAQLNSDLMNKLLNQILYTQENTTITKINDYCVNLLDLYIRKNNLKSQNINSINIDNQEIRDMSTKAEDLGRIDIQIKALEKALINILESEVDTQNNNGNTALFIDEHHKHLFRELIHKFTKHQSTEDQFNENNIADFVQIYAFKIHLLSNEEFKKQVYTDFSKYIFTTSVGVLGAKYYIERKYGNFISELLEDSFLGNIDSGNNISKYFMGTLFFLLNDNQKDFNLKNLCIGGINEGISTQTFSAESGLGQGFCESYNLSINGIEIMNIIGEYYSDLNKDGIIKNFNLDMLKWNLIGGINTGIDCKKVKKGIFRHIDKQLKEFQIKLYDEEVYRQYNNFKNVESLEKAKKLMMKIQLNQGNNLFQLNLKMQEDRELLSEIAKRIIIHQKDFNLITDKDMNQLILLKYEYEKIMQDENKDDEYKKELESLFEIMINDKNQYVKFRNDYSYDIRGFHENYRELKFYIPITSDQNKNNLLKNYFQSIDNKVDNFNKRKFNLLYNNTKISYIKESVETNQELLNKINNYQIFKDIEHILDNIDNLKQFMIFYHQVKNDAFNHKKTINLIADLSALVMLSGSAIITTKKYVETLYNLYKQLTDKTKKNDKITEDELIQYSIMSVFFNILAFQEDYNLFVSDMTNNQWGRLKKSFKELTAKQQELLEELLKNKTGTEKFFAKDFQAILKLEEKEKLYINFVAEIPAIKEFFSTKEVINKLHSISATKTSIHAINLCNKLQIQQLLSTQTKIIENFVNICTGDQNQKLKEDTDSFFCEIYKAINNITKENSEEEKIHNLAENIFNTFDWLLNNNSNHQNKLEITTKLNDNIIKNVRDLYGYLKTEDNLNIKLNRIPFIYKTLLTTNKEPNIIVQYYRIFSSLLTGVNISHVESKQEDDKRLKNVKVIIESLYSIQDIRLNVLSSMSYLTKELMDNFEEMSNAIQNNSNKKIKSIMNLINRITSQYTEKKSETGKINLKMIIEELEEEQLNNQLIIPQIDILNEIIKEIKSEEIEYNKIIELFKNKINQSCEAEKGYLNDKLTDYINITVNMCNKLKELSIKCDTLQSSYAGEIGNLKEKIKNLNEHSNNMEELISKEQVDNLQYLANYFNSFDNPIYNNNNNFKVYKLTSSIIQKLVDIFNICFDQLTSINKSGSDYKIFAVNRETLETSKNYLMQNGLTEFEISFFNDADKIDAVNHDVNIKKKVSNYLTSNTINKLNLKDIEEWIIKNENDGKKYQVYKYYVNQHQYKLLADKLSRFYLTHYFELEGFYNLFNQCIDYIIKKGKEEQNKQQISNYTDKFCESFNELVKKYEKYQKDSSDLLNKVNKITAEEREKLLNKLTTKQPDWQKHSVLAHEWIIKTMEIIQILKKISSNDIPTLRIALHMEILFDYLSIYVFGKDKDKVAELNKIKPDVINFMKGVKVVDEEGEKKRKSQVTRLQKTLNELFQKPPPYFDSLYNKLQEFFKSFFAIDNNEIKNITEIINILNTFWEEGIENVNSLFNDYEKDLQSVEEIICSQNAETLEKKIPHIKESMKQILKQSAQYYQSNEPEKKSSWSLRDVIFQIIEALRQILNKHSELVRKNKAAKKNTIELIYNNRMDLTKLEINEIYSFLDQYINSVIVDYLNTYYGIKEGDTFTNFLITLHLEYFFFSESFKDNDISKLSIESNYITREIILKFFKKYFKEISNKEIVIERLKQRKCNEFILEMYEYYLKKENIRNQNGNRYKDLMKDNEVINLKKG